MIPQRLELTNFLSYRETAVLSFDGIHLACISGANGSGKSSILDAITWTLFGRSRSRSDDDLVNRLAAIKDEAAEVRFTFSLEDIQYRVQRRKKIGKSGVLELQISVGENNWKTLSENRIRETQTAIERLLRMNYDTFTNASFLLQGKADEFTTRTPNQRKEILADLLGVSVWEQYRDLAAEARKIEQGKSVVLESRLEDISRELGEESERKAALEEAQEQRAAIAGKLKVQEKLLNHMRQTSAAADQQGSLVANLRKSAERIDRSLDRSKQAFSERQEERDTFQTIISAQTEIEAAFSAWQAAEAKAQSWQEKANTYNQLLQEKRPFDLALAQAQSRLEQQLKQLEEQEQRVSSAITGRPKLQSEIKTNQRRLAEIESALQKLGELQEELHEARAELQQTSGERRLLQQELDQIQQTERQIQKLEESREAVSDNKAKAEQRLKSLENELSSISSKNLIYLESKAELDSINSQQPLLRQEMDKLRDRINRLLEPEHGSTCPLCGQPLTEQHRQDVITELEDDGKKRADIWRNNSARIADLKKELPELEQALKQQPILERDKKAQQQRLVEAEARLVEIDERVLQWNKDNKSRMLEIKELLADETAYKNQEKRVMDLEAQLGPRAKLQEEQQKAQRKLADDSAQITTIEHLIEEWQSEGRAQLTAIHKQLADGDFALEARAALANLQIKLDELNYDPVAHQDAKDEQDALSAAEIRYQKLKQAQAAVKPLENTLAELQQRIQEQENELEDQQQQLQSAESLLATLKEDIVDILQVEDQVFLLREEEIAANRLVGAAEQRLAVLDELREQKGQIELDKTAASLRIQRLTFLEKSCSRSGVQALLIEHALPEIEERANQLLDRLTGGDMSIYFETQRKLKTRDTLSETLDIHISDKDGQRPYDNYSGGEQFRVNFAIRIALSQLLAKRAGARLQTLIVDEGFGSQDPQGRQRLIEAINTVSDEFACILIITHIDELRDVFPTRIEVSKNMNGSKITVV